MAAATDAVGAPISLEGRRLLRHAHLHARHGRLEQAICDLKARAALGGDNHGGRELSHGICGLERELDAVRRELRDLSQRAPQPSARG